MGAASSLESLQSLVEANLSGEYQIQSILRDDAGLTVAFAQDAQSGKRVVLQAAAGLSTGETSRLDYELSTLHSFRSDYVPDVLDFFVQDDSAAIVLEYVTGTELSTILEAGVLPVNQTLEYAITILHGLRELHSRGVYHRDVRPENVVVEANGAVKLIRTHFTSQSILASRNADRIRRSNYLSPEQTGSLERDVLAPADLYSVGALIYFMLSGRPPYVADSVSSVLLAHMTAPIPTFQAADIQAPQALEQVVHRLLSKDPNDRYQTTDAVLFDLEQIRQAYKQGHTDINVVIGSHDDRKTLIEPSFVARETELAEMANQMRAATAGQAGLVLLEGESGAGKSRLLAELARRAVAEGFTLFRGRGTNESALAALQVLNGVADSMVSAAAEDEQLVARFLDEFQGDTSNLATTLPALGQLWGHQPGSAEGPEAFVEARTRQTLSDFLDALGSPTHPAFLILDDCQWADEQTFRLLQHWSKQAMAATGRHVLILVACRSEEVGPDHPLRKLPTALHLKLTGLPPADIRSLAESMAGSLPDEALQFVVEAAGGSPFMAAALVRGLVESKAITPAENGWQIQPQEFAACQSSNSASDFLIRRLSLLGHEAIELLTCAAVIGKEFELAAVSQLAGMRARQALRKFNEARQRHMVWLRHNGTHGVFAHDKIREALLERLKPADRQRIHLAAANYLVSHATTKAAEISFHFDAAGHCEQALPYAVQAAEDARAKSALEVARRQFMIAERAVSQDDRFTQYRICQGLGDVLTLQGAYGDAEPYYRRCASLADSPLAQARSQGALAELARKRGDLETAITNYEGALETLGTTVPKRAWRFIFLLVWELLVQTANTCFPRFRLNRRRRPANEPEQLSISLLSGLVHAYWYVRGKPETLWAHFRGLNLGEQFEPSLELANAYSVHAPVMTLLGMFGRSYQYAERSFQIRKDLGDLWGQGHSLCFHACALYAGSRFEDALQKGRESVRLLERAGDYWCVHISRYQVAASLFRLGRMREALDECRKNYDSGIAVGDEQATGIITELWAQVSDGHVPAEIVETELQRDRIDRQASCQVLVADCVNQLKAGNTIQAVSQVDEAVRIVQQAGISNCYTLPAYLWRVIALRKLAEQQAASLAGLARQRTLQRAFRAGVRGLAESWLCQNDVPRIYRELALIRSMQGHPRQAGWLLRRSANLAERLHMDYDRGLSLRLLGELGRIMEWPQADSWYRQGHALLRPLLANQNNDGSSATARAKSDTLSLADRFDTILDVGRRLTAALGNEEVYQHAREAAVRLLRCEDCRIAELTDQGTLRFVIGTAGDSPHQESELARHALTEGKSVLSGEHGEHQLQTRSGSQLCVPIYVLGEAQAFMFAAHSRVRNLFGANEQRLADFIATIAGASIESAFGYSQLRSLNANLEQRVAERTAAAESRAVELAASNEELERTASDLRRTEEQLRDAIDAAQAASQAKSQFLATMSHEIRTPMNGILGMTELALRTEVTPQQENCLAVVKQSGEALLTLLNDVLDFSKIEAGKMEIESIDFDLRSVVENAMKLLSTVGYSKNLEFYCEISNDVPSHVLGDPSRLRQIVSNLLGNAVKFTSEGEIHLRVWLRETGHVAFSVRDTGIGIPEHKQAAIFNAFQQSDSSTTRKYGGTGLGLSICKTLVELMGGDIQLHSEAGKGSTFEFWLPLPASATNPSHAQRLDEYTELRGLTVAFCSDSHTSQQSHLRALEGLGMHVLLAAGLAELDEDELQIVDVIIVDNPNEDAQQRMEQLPNTTLALALPQHAESMRVAAMQKPTTQRHLAQELLALRGDRPKQSQPSAQPAAAKSLHILLADDSPVNQEVAVGLLEFFGHTVALADNGREAVDKSQQERFDVILMDLEMPEMDGLEATRQIRQRSDAPPIVAMTAHAIEAIQQQCHAAGMADYLTKPVDPDALSQVLDAVTSGAETCTADAATVG